MFKTTFVAAALTMAVALPAAADLLIEDAYARSSGPSAKAGAAFFTIRNTNAEDDTLIAVATDIAKLAELHTHIDAGNGVMQMRRVEGGFPVAAGGMHVLQRGGDHVMLMGLTRPMTEGETITVTLTFEKAGEMTVEIPVDLTRDDAMPMQMSN